MNYKLAKQLKEAGYPQPKYFTAGNYYEKNEGMISIPTLSELIDACGDRIKMIDTTEYEKANNITILQANKSLLGNNKFAIILKDWKYLEESLAKLWLILNNKI